MIQFDVPRWFKVWFAIVATIGAGLLALFVWAVIAIVSAVTR